MHPCDRYSTSDSVDTKAHVTRKQACYNKDMREVDGISMEIKA